MLKLRKQKAEEKLPEALGGLRIPPLQLSQEFMAAKARELDFDQVARGYLKSYQDQTRDLILGWKEKELAYYANATDLEQLIPTVRHSVLTFWEDHVQGVAKVLVFSLRKDPATGLEIAGSEHITAFDTNPVLVRQRDVLLDSIPRLLHAVLSLEKNKELRDKAKMEAKKALKDIADVEMADAGRTESSEASLGNELKLIRKELAALKVEVSSTTSPSTSAQTNTLDIAAEEGAPKVRQGQSRRGPKRQKSLTPGPLDQSPPQTTRQKRGRKGKGKASRQTQTQAARQGQGQGKSFPGWSVEAPRKGKGKGEIDPHQYETILARLCEYIRSQPWDYSHPSTYPDEFLCVPVPVGVGLSTLR